MTLPPFPAPISPAEPVRLQATAGDALGEAMVAILREAGYDAGMGVHMAAHYLWVKRPAAVRADQ